MRRSAYGIFGSAAVVVPNRHIADQTYAEVTGQLSPYGPISDRIRNLADSGLDMCNAVSILALNRIAHRLHNGAHVSAFRGHNSQGARLLAAAYARDAAFPRFPLARGPSACALSPRA